MAGNFISPTPYTFSNTDLNTGVVFDGISTAILLRRFGGVNSGFIANGANGGMAPGFHLKMAFSMDAKANFPNYGSDGPDVITLFSHSNMNTGTNGNVRGVGLHYSWSTDEIFFAIAGYPNANGNGSSMSLIYGGTLGFQANEIFKVECGFKRADAAEDEGGFIYVNGVQKAFRILNSTNTTGVTMGLGGRYNQGYDTIFFRARGGVIHSTMVPTSNAYATGTFYGNRNTNGDNYYDDGAGQNTNYAWDISNGQSVQDDQVIKGNLYYFAFGWQDPTISASPHFELKLNAGTGNDIVDTGVSGAYSQGSGLNGLAVKWLQSTTYSNGGSYARAALQDDSGIAGFAVEWITTAVSAAPYTLLSNNTPTQLAPGVGQQLWHLPHI